jgi:hypothetical protein
MLLDKGYGGEQWCSQRISWVHILWCIMGSFFGKKSPKETLSSLGNILLQISYFEKQFVNKPP